MVKKKFQITGCPCGKDDLKKRVFLMLQGPQSGFFPALALALVKKGAKVIKINLCGGDYFLWHRYFIKNDNVTCINYHGGAKKFMEFITSIYHKYQVTDIMSYSDWRPFHQEAILVAKFYNLNVWVYEEGYLRQGFVTLEENGVNGRSSVPHSPEVITELAKTLPPLAPSIDRSDTFRKKVIYAVMHHFGNVVLFPLFPFYRTHREHNIFVELLGILPRYFKRYKRASKSERTLKEFFAHKGKYFFYPLQLNHDSQVQLYSPYLRQEEAISTVIYSFAKNASKDSRLLIKNHPLDNGLIPYANIIKAISSSLGCADRVVYVEDGNTNMLVKESSGVVLINSTVGLSALRAYKRVFCLGDAIYAMQGLAASYKTSSLDDFWEDEEVVNKKLVEDFCKVLQARALVSGDFYNHKGSLIAAASSIRRFIKKGEKG